MSSSLKHVAIIMDGNGRWAKRRGHSRYWGHVRGAKAARSIISEAAKINLEYLTLFAFSTENWQRPKEEVDFLMHLLGRQLKKEIQTLKKNNIRFHCLGQLEALPESAKKVVQQAIDETKENTGTQLLFALNYSGRADLTCTVKDLALKVKAGTIDPDNITEDLINESLFTGFAPDPDLIIRTSGEKRLSNFMLWQSAYSELYFTDKMWPEFSAADFHQAIEYYNTKERRFGKTGEQLKTHPSLTSSAL